jgi:hypothetical protein
MAFLSQNALFSALRMVGLASAFLALVFVINNFLIFGIDAPGVINTLRKDITLARLCLALFRQALLGLVLPMPSGAG